MMMMMMTGHARDRNAAVDHELRGPVMEEVRSNRVNLYSILVTENVCVTQQA